MAMLGTYGLEGLELSLQELAALPESVLGDMLAAEGDVIRNAQKKQIRALGLVDTKQLAESITINRKIRKKNNESYITVYPKGQRTAKGKKKAESKPPRNAEVGFVLEYGAAGRKIGARQWMRTANETAAEAAVTAAEAVYHKWLGDLGL